MSDKDIMAQMAMTAEEMKEMSIRQAAGMRNEREDEMSRFGTGLQNAYKPAVSKHTPGPWHYNGFSDHCDVGRKYHEITDSEGFEIINQNGVVTSERDARLIAAAPELLESLRYFLEARKDGGKIALAMAADRAESAIAKATVE